MASKLRTVLITGGTGFIGKALYKHLLALGYKVYILTRTKKYTQNIGLSYINSFDELSNIDIDIIINLAGETIAKRWTKNAKNNIYNSRIITTNNIIKYIQHKKNKPKIFISASSVGYYGTDEHAVFDEESDIAKNKQEFSHFLCKNWEEKANSAKEFGVRVALLRIAPVLAKDGGILSKLLPSFYIGLGSLIGNGKQWFSWIDRDDLINLILFVISNNEIHGPVNATAPCPVTNKDFSLKLAKVINRPCFFKIPGFVFKLLFGQMADEIMLNGQKVLPKKALKHGFRFSYPTIEKSLKVKNE